MSAEIEYLLCLMDEGYDQRSWYGPNLMDGIRDLTAEQADWRGRPDGHRIVDIVVHCAYWKYAGRCYLLGLPLDTFPVEGKDWCVIPDPLPAANWKEYLQLLADQHQQACEAIRSFPSDRLSESPADSPITFGQLLRGVATHDVYHAGQIQMILGAHKQAP